MGIEDDDIQAVRDRTDIVQIISQYTQLKRVGRRFSGLCPFHSERTPSFSVNAEEGLYYCFGCGVGGDAIRFVREKEQLDFVGAVELLAAKCGVSLRYTDPGGGEERKRRLKLQDAVGRAVDYYHDKLLSADDGGAARSYLRKRGFDAEMVRRFQVGWAADDWDRLARHLRLGDEDLSDSGLGFVNRRGRQQDFFRGRIVFPIFDPQGAALGFGGRILPGGEGSKYKNSSESPIYAKSRVLYGLNWAKESVVEADEVIVCEGYTDVIGFAMAGIDRAVATCGTALTDEHVTLLRRFARRVVLAFDADAAGQNAAARFYEWERKHDLDVAVADLPPGIDPGELAQSDPDRLHKAVAEARPFLEFRIERALAEANLDSAEGRARAAELTLDMVREHPSDIVRDQYAMLIASRCRLNEDLVRDKLRQPSTRPAGPDPTEARRHARPVASADPSGPGRGSDGRRRSDGDAPRIQLRDGPEVEALRVAMHRSVELAQYLDAEVFDDEVCQRIYQLLETHGGVRAALDHAGPELTDTLQRLAVQESGAEPLEVAALLWRPYLDRRLAQISTETASVESLRAIADLQIWLRSKADELQEPSRQAPAIAELLTWVRDTREEHR